MGKQVVNGLKNGLRTLPYVGGKSSFGGPGAWIAKILSSVHVDTYVEPCMGTLGILLRRDPVCVEVCNDRDERIVNFFRVIRDSPLEFSERLMLTPFRSESEFAWAKNNLRHDDKITAAVACFMVLSHSIPASLIARSDYLIKGKMSKWELPDDVLHLANRLNGVRFVVSDANEIISRFIGDSKAIIYIDPPYPDTLGYDHDIDRAKFVDAVCAKNRHAFVAVSGFSDSWPELVEAGYQKSERKIHLQMDTAKKGNRVEALYTSWSVFGYNGLFATLDA